MKVSLRSLVAATGCCLAALLPISSRAEPGPSSCPGIEHAIKGGDVDALAAELAKKPKSLNTACIGSGAQAQVPLAVVVNRFDNDLARKITDKDATIDAHNRRMEQMLNMLVKAGADVNWRDPADQLTLLMLAVMSEAPTAVKTLLKAGSDPNLKSKDGETALKLAQQGGPDAAPLVELLKKAGAKE